MIPNKDRRMIAVPALLFVLAAAAPETPNKGVHGDWTVQCATQVDVPPCEIAQAATSTRTREPVMRIAFAYRGSGERYAVQIRLPLGIRLSQPPLLRLDETTDLEGYGFTRCDTDGCYIERVLGTPEIMRLRAAKTGVLAVLGSDGKPMVLPLSFNGFAEALDASALQNTAWAKAAHR